MSLAKRKNVRARRKEDLLVKEGNSSPNLQSSTTWQKSSDDNKSLINQGWAIAHSHIAHFRSFQKYNCVIALFFALFKSAIVRSHFFRSFQKCDKRAIAQSLLRKEWMCKKSGNFQISNLKRAIVHLQSVRLPNPASVTFILYCRYKNSWE